MYPCELDTLASLVSRFDDHAIYSVMSVTDRDRGSLHWWGRHPPFVK